MSATLLSFYQKLVIEHPRIVLSLLALVVFTLVLGLPNLKLDASADSLTLEHDDSLDLYRTAAKRYGGSDYLVLTFKPYAELFSDDALQTLTALRDDLSAIEGISSINTILDLPLLYSPKASLIEVKQGVRTLMSDGVKRSAAREEFLHSPIYKNMVLGPDQQTTVLLLNIAADDRYLQLVRRRDALRAQQRQRGLSDREAAELEEVSAEFRAYRTAVQGRAHARVEEVRAVMDKYRSKAELFLGGVSMITHDMIEFIRNDLIVFGSAIVLFIIALLAFIFRKLRWVIVPLSVCVLSVAMMLGWIAWIDWRLTVISSNFVALLLIIALAITIHLVVRYREYHAENPEWSQKETVMATVRFMARPCLYTALTTIVAFASLVVSDIRPVIDFGWLMTIGLTVALILAFILLPAALMILPKGEPAESPNRFNAFTLRFSRITEHHGAWVLVVSVAVALLSALGISQLRVENRFIDYFKESTEIYQGLSVIDQSLGGTTPLDILIDAAPEDLVESADLYLEDDPFDEDFGEEFDEDPFAVQDPLSEKHPETSATDSYWFTIAGLKEIEALHNYLEGLPEVGKVQSLAMLYEVGRDLNGGGINDFELAFMRQGLPQKIENVLVDPYLSSENNQVRITLRTVESSPELYRQGLPQKIRDYAVNELGFEPEQIQFTGLLVLYNNMLSSLFKSQILTLGAVFLGIMLMFMVLFRSLLVAVVAIIPNILAAASVLGFMGLANIPLDMMTITIAAITVGIGVDDTIHYIHRFKEELKIDGDYVATMHRSHASIGRAMYYTSVIIIVGFSILALSNFVPSVYFGLLTGLAMFAALAGALLLLPKLIIMLHPFGEPKISRSVEFRQPYRIPS